MKAAPWQVDVHEIRVVASAELQGEPTPEGIHRDGAEFVTVHLVELNNAAGGSVTLYDNQKRPQCSFTLQEIMDSYYFQDPRVWHSAAPISPADPALSAVRSILTFDFHYCPTLERP